MTGPPRESPGIGDGLSGRYVVLLHTGWGEEHFDLMLERPGRPGLMTFRCPAWPVAGRARLERLADHREAYLSYEGPVSGDRGEVRRVESGIYRAARSVGSGLEGPVVLVAKEGAVAEQEERRVRLLREGQGWAIQAE